MRQRRVEYAARASRGLADIYDWVLDAAGRSTAEAYVGGIVRFCNTLGHAPFRGSLHDALIPGLRAIGYRKRVTIAFVVEEEVVVILGIFRKGRNWTADFGR